MIVDPTTSMTLLRQFFTDTLPNDTLDLPDLVRADTITGYNLWSPLVIDSENLKIINLPNCVQSPYVLKSKNLKEVNLSSLNQTEFGMEYLNYQQEFLPFSILQGTKIRTLDLPNFVGTTSEIPATGMTIENAARASFRNNYWLQTVSMGNSFMPETSAYSFNGFWFRNNYSLIALKLNYPYVIPIDRTEGLNTTPIKAGNGYIYVPSNLLTSYRNHSVWRNISAGKFKTLEEYNTDILRYQDTITDSWAQIIANCNNNNYGGYKIGDTKTIMVNDVPVQMVIVATRQDTLEDGTTPAPLTWMSKTISLFTRYNLGSTFSGGVNFHNSSPSQEHSEPIGYRDIFMKTIWDGLDSTLQNGIKAVTKYSVGYTNEGDFSNSIASIEKIWPPSASEVNLQGYTSPYPYFSNLPVAAEAAIRPNYCLGLTNLINDESGTTITVGTRDYHYNTGYPDLLRATGSDTTMEVVYSSGINSYIIFGFCT